MVEIEKYDCADGNEARKRGRQLYEINFEVANLNTVYPARSSVECKAQYRKKNAEKIRQSKAQYRKDHAEILIAF